MLSLDRYESHVECAWCKGCGNFGILNGVKKTLSELDLEPHQVSIFTGIGQAPKLPHYMKVNTFNGLHGREVAHAQGFRMVNEDQVVLVHGGEGGIYGEGGNHFTHAIRRNLDMTVVVHDNHIYGLTKGQASPTTEKGTITKVNPNGVSIEPLNPLALAISQSCSFVAQVFSGDSKMLVSVLKAAIEHKGFSYINLFQPCVTWDKTHTYKFFKDHLKPLEETWDPTNRMAALAKVLDPENVPVGIIYRNTREPYNLHLGHKVKVDFSRAKMKKLSNLIDRYQ
jgi:2-oxoglutarate/2-oxoacid ferredoxin oxidoreductase subunit beta